MNPADSTIQKTSTLVKLTETQTGNFLSKFEKGHPDECWLWKAAKNKSGYGVFLIGKSSKLAHRLAWFINHGEIPSGLCVCHSCDIRLCVNPNHLWLGTPKNNMDDCISKGRAVYLSGNRHGMRIHPEKAARGDKNGARLHPERLARGDRNGTHTHPESVMRGEGHPSSKLTNEKVTEIRKRYFEQSNTLAQISKEFGIRIGHAWKVIHRKVWKHI